MDLRRTDKWDKFYPISLSVIVVARISIAVVARRRRSQQQQ
jgi:hypothetical protein